MRFQTPKSIGLYLTVPFFSPSIQYVYPKAAADGPGAPNGRLALGLTYWGRNEVVLLSDPYNITVDEMAHVGVTYDSDTGERCARSLSTQ